MADTVSVTFRCPKCSTALQSEVERQDADEVTCSNADCDATFGTWGEVRAQAKAAVVDKIRDDLRASMRKAFKGSKNVRFK